MPLQSLQRQIERIYGIAVGHDVNDFLITDPKLAKALEDNADARDTREKLLIAQGDDSLDLSLYLDQHVLDHLRREDPHKRLHEGNLSDFWVALEGVSHFIYLLWNVAGKRSVTQLELELQAEVDKYVTSLTMLWREQNCGVPSQLHNRLFRDAHFDAALDDDGLERYRDANRYAARYCGKLASQHTLAYHNSRLIEELRHFYRLSQPEKIRHIDS